MKNSYKILTTTLLIGTLFTTGCSLHKADTAHKKTTKTIQNKKDLTVPAKESIAKNTILLNKVSALKTEIADLEKKIAQTDLGADRAVMVKKKVALEKEVEAIQKQQIVNAKTFKDSQQKK